MSEPLKAEKASPRRNGRPALFRILPLASVAFAVLVFALVGVVRSRRDTAADTDDVYAAVPFHPKVTYNSSDLTISNTEEEPYLDTSFRIYVESTLYTLQIGTIRPGETVKRPLRDLTNELGESFNPGIPRTSQLEVRAHFRGYDDHKDFPPP